MTAPKRPVYKCPGGCHRKVATQYRYCPKCQQRSREIRFVPLVPIPKRSSKDESSVLY